MARLTRGRGAQDLIVGSPHAATTLTNTQVGRVLVFLSSSRHRGSLDALASADFVLEGDHSYAWFGSSAAVGTFATGERLVCAQLRAGARAG